MSQATEVSLSGSTMSFVEYAGTGAATWTEAFPPHAPELPEPRRFGTLPCAFDRTIDKVVPAVGLLRGADLLCAGPAGTVLAADGTILTDQSWYRDHTRSMRVTGQSFRIVDLPGSAVSLATEWSCSSYGHFLQDSLTRLAILDRLQVALAGFDHVICGTPTAFSRKLLTVFGVDERRIVSPRADVAYRAGLLTATTFPGARRGMERWAADFIRQRVTAPTRSGRRIYVMRKSRRPVNEDALLPILRASGFELYAPEEDQDNQAKTFSEASIVVGSAGSALANLLFCRPSTLVLELLPTRHMYPYYFLLSNAAGLRYSTLVCAVDENSLAERGARKADFHVDPEHFAGAISSLVLEDVETRSRSAGRCASIDPATPLPEGGRSPGQDAARPEGTEGGRSRLPEGMHPIMPEQSASTGASKPPIRTVVVPSLAAFRLEPGEAVYEVNGEALPLHVYGKFAGSGVPLIVFGQGMVQRSVVQMPRFQRMNWADRFPENVLVLNDPTLYLADDMALGWMIGTEQHNVLLRIVALVRQVQAQLGIQDRNILFYGSSAGGFASLMLSAHFQDPAVFVNNPQTDVLKFRRGGVRRLLELGFGGMTVAEAAERHGARFSYPEALRQGARLPRLYYLQNIFDRDHYKDQLLPLLAQLTLSPEANTEQFVDRRLVLDLYADPKTEHNPLGLSRTLACMDIVRPWIAVGGAAPRGGP